MHLTTLHALYVEQLKDLYGAAHQVMRALPKMAKLAAQPRLRTAFNDQNHEAQVHIDRLEKMFVRLGEGPKGSPCHAIEGIIAEGRDLSGEHAQPTVMDVALIAASQRMGHYLIAGLGSALTLARGLGQRNAAALLQEMLEVGVAADLRMSDISEAMIETDAKVPSGSL